MKGVNVYHNIDGKTLMIKNKDPDAAWTNGHLNCWVCEGWREKEFRLTKIKSVQHIEDPVYIHFEFDDWQPGLMTQMED